MNTKFISYFQSNNNDDDNGNSVASRHWIMLHRVCPALDVPGTVLGTRWVLMGADPLPAPDLDLQALLYPWAHPWCPRLWFYRKEINSVFG